MLIKTCYICLSDADQCEIITGCCQCRGSIGSIHRTCLQMMLNSRMIDNNSSSRRNNQFNNNNICSICQCQFQVPMEKRLKRLNQWQLPNHHHFQGAPSCLLAFFVAIVISLGYCFVAFKIIDHIFQFDFTRGFGFDQLLSVIALTALLVTIAFSWASFFNELSRWLQTFFHINSVLEIIKK